ncbi:PiggyBac transposable element-derived protein 3 [Trichinella zimbabwensis]|uniref:PiggyBac transposable element-derived protein 3 n=1 Tax=Trichinella zimbabwensis TaxID=268475 RepID=A0A0V1I8A4_9BILA|nr:PiggyBac transposable element-derived protein 3 [Trichinella zimbabwensis]
MLGVLNHSDILHKDAVGDLVVEEHPETQKLPWSKGKSFSRNIGRGTPEFIQKGPQLVSMLPIASFHLFFPREQFQHFAQMTVGHALQNGRCIAVAAEDIMQFVGHLLLSGYHIAPSENMRQTWKSKPLYDYVNTRLLQFGVFYEHLTIDELMVPFYGHHTSNMYMRDKPIRFGQKIYVLPSSDGYPYFMELRRC